ncbi:MAG: radical SAM protein [Candidatus Thermoplasmatota archaeon]
MFMEGYLKELKNCTLCEWRCGVNRLEGEKGVCMLGEPKIASTTLHPAPPQSYTVFMAGCNYRCLNCQNWTIAHFPEKDTRVRGYLAPKQLSKEAVAKIRSRRGSAIGADRIFFSGGSPTPSLPYVEKVVEEARKIDGGIKVNYDTNGFLTEPSLERVLDFTDSITFDIKAFEDRTHRELTGAPVEPVLRNAKTVAERAPDKLWEYRYLLIPGVNEKDVEPLAEFLAEIDESLPLNFLAFRPNFVLEDHPGAGRKELESAVKRAKRAGLENVSWTGSPGISGEKDEIDISRKSRELGCTSDLRNCGGCEKKFKCPVKKYRPGGLR